ncbi:MAG: FAD-binding protein [Clostridia bacterium]|nr:FAD-binding protein [Clostridia bacterium]
MYDVAIIGGGPAGATLARLIGKKYKVLLLEKRSWEKAGSKKEKCCGGLIAPDAQLMLAKFGLGIPKSILVSPQLFAVRTIDMDNHLERFYQRHYLNVDREEFDRWLQGMIPAEVHKIQDCVYKSYEIREDGIEVKFHANGKEYSEKTKLLVGADGAFSKVRSQGFGKWPSPQLYVSIQEWFQTQGDLDYYGAIFDREITDFYSWTIPKENAIILGSALKPGRNAVRKFELLKKKLTSHGFEFGKSVKRNGTYLLRPLSCKQICTGNDEIVLIGEAAGFISPSSAEGMSYAFRSALALAKSLEIGTEEVQARYRENTNSLKSNILVKNMKSPVMYNKTIRKYILQTGVLSVEIENNAENTICCLR